ncbi:hypothetical protein LYNGBM3L_20050 [Moorena producens 3L]|uniref:Uncharacterized protein n=1 Tax=Moorena producens 3L TaxID=489825 RepID=F4XMJ2_9CYAN|nr:hypothetical protein LYNGBM3L_20050 [Moorena producens 3L]
MVVENHDFSTVGFDQVLYKFKPKPGESVSTGNNKRELISSHKSIQYGFKPKSFEIKPRSDVLDDFAVWE